MPKTKMCCILCSFMQMPLSGRAERTQDQVWRCHV